MNYIYHLATAQYSAGKRCILALMWLIGDKKNKQKKNSKDCTQTFFQKQETPGDKNHTEVTLVPKRGNRCCDNTKSAQEHPKSFFAARRALKKVPNPDLMDDVTQNMHPPQPINNETKKFHIFH